MTFVIQSIIYIFHAPASTLFYIILRSPWNSYFASLLNFVLYKIEETLQYLYCKTTQEVCTIKEQNSANYWQLYFGHKRVQVFKCLEALLAMLLTTFSIRKYNPINFLSGLCLHTPPPPLRNKIKSTLCTL